jgi:hypothetical protein
MTNTTQQQQPTTIQQQRIMYLTSLTLTLTPNPLTLQQQQQEQRIVGDVPGATAAVLIGGHTALLSINIRLHR